MVTFKEAKDVADSVVKALHPVCVVLFGSVAREGKGTDMDILVVTDDRSGTHSDSNLLLQKCLKKYYEKFAIDPFVVPRSLLNEYYLRGSPFLRLILKEGRLLYMKNITTEWIKQAQEDLNAAIYLSEGKYFRSACFHSQQSMEKSIKAFLLKEGWDLERIHNIRRLVSIGKGYYLPVDVSEEEITFMDSIYRGRYPAEAGLLPLGEPSEADAERGIHIAKRIFETIQTALI